MSGADRLEIADLVVDTATRTAVDGVSLVLERGQVLALLGPNGAGKSELVLGVAGLMPVRGGTVRLGDRELVGLAPEAIRRAGVAAVPEGHRTLADLSVDDNLAAAGSMHGRAALRDATARARDVFPELAPLGAQPAGSLSGGQQQMLALAQAIVCRPAFLLADEMSLGLAPIVVGRLMDVMRTLRDEGTGVLLIEQFTHVALGVADAACVMNRGRIAFSGSPDELRARPGLLRDAYLSDREEAG